MIWFVKTLSKRRMFVSFMKISACWLLHRLIKFNKVCWEKRPAKPRPNLRTSFCRRDLKNIQPHLKTNFLRRNFWNSIRTFLIRKDSRQAKCLSQRDRCSTGTWYGHAACTKRSKPFPLGKGKVKRDVSLSHGQVIYPRWRPVLDAGQALCPRWNLSQSNLSQSVAQRGTTRPWNFSCMTRTYNVSKILQDKNKFWTCLRTRSVPGTMNMIKRIWTLWLSPRELKKSEFLCSSAWRYERQGALQTDLPNCCVSISWQSIRKRALRRCRRRAPCS